MAIKIEFQKYTQAGSDNYTTVECQNASEVANALINILTNRKKGFPREIMKNDTKGNDGVIVIDTHVTQQKPRSKKSSVDITME